MKGFNFWNLCLVIMLSTGYLSCAQTQSDIVLKEDEQLISFTTDRFTLPNLHITSDKKQIIFDVLGDIYQVPIEGGDAELLLQDKHWKRGAKLSPDGRTIAYISDESGEFRVWTYDLKTHTKRVYPIIESIHYPLNTYWKNNKEILIPNEEGLVSYHIHTGESTCIRKAKEDEKSLLNVVNRTISVNNPATVAGFQKNGNFWFYDFQKKRDFFVDKIPETKLISFFKMSPQSQKILYYVLDNDDYSKQLLKKWDIETKKSVTLLDSDKVSLFSTSNYGYDFIDDSTIIVDKQGEIVRMDIETGKYVSIPIKIDLRKVIKKPLQPILRYISDSIITASVLRNSITQPKLDTIYFGAFGKLHSYAKTTGEIKEVYPDKNRFEVSPSLSPDGKYLAYTTWNDWEMGHLYVRELNTGKDYQITEQPGRYINPAWSPNGLEIVFIADETENKMGIGKLSPGSNVYSYHLDIHQIKAMCDLRPCTERVSTKIKRIYPYASFPRRFYPIPVYSSDGQGVYLSKRDDHENNAVFSYIDIVSLKEKCETLIPNFAEEVIISPDSKHIALIMNEQVWLVDTPVKTKINFYNNSIKNVELKNAKSIFEIAPSYLSWQNENILMWSSVDEIFTYDVRTHELKKIASIKPEKPRAIPKTRYALTNTRIITMNQRNQIIENGTILVKNNRIETIGESTKTKIPTGYKVFDLSGKTIIPGLIDVHAHFHFSPYEFRNQQVYQYIGNLAYGVTTIYDPSVNVLDYREQAQMVETGDLLGPRVFASGNVIFEEPGPNQYFYIEIRKKEDAIRLLESYRKLGVSGPIKDYLIQNKNIRSWLREASKQKSIGITAHQSYMQVAINRLLNGYTAIEHEIGNSLFQDDIRHLIGQSGIHYTPTFIVGPSFGNLFLEYTQAEEAKLLALNGRALFQNKYDHNTTLPDSEDQEIFYREDEKRKIKINRGSSVLKDIKEKGGNISVGGHGNPLPGIGTHMELWSFTYGEGLSNYDALQSATINGAKKLSLQKEIGSIEKGKLADLVVLNSNPLDNIFNTTDILYTIQNGNVYEAETMKQIYPIKRELKPWGWDSPIVLENMESIYQAK